MFGLYFVVGTCAAFAAALVIDWKSAEKTFKKQHVELMECYQIIKGRI